MVPFLRPVPLYLQYLGARAFPRDLARWRLQPHFTMRKLSWDFNIFKLSRNFAAYQLCEYGGNIGDGDRSPYTPAFMSR